MSPLTGSVIAFIQYQVFFISKLVDYLFLPPGTFIILLILAYVFFRMKKTRLFQVFLVVSIVLLYLASIEPVKDALLFPLENRYPPYHVVSTGPGTPRKAGYICILGGGISVSSPEEGGRGSPSGGALKRMVYGRRIAAETGLPVILAGGIVFRNSGSMPEADVMKGFLIALGMDETRLLTEDRSRNTWENAVFVKERYQPDTIILVTSAFHMPRSVYAFSMQGIDCIPAPTDYRTNRGPYSIRSFLPTMGALEGVHTALKEYIGLLYYTLRYR